ncbi:MAG: ATP-binding cassette domain-containing protein [Oscillospiraceae bacterium]|nr:ATP-binding cassette domain-containing protein [Oscillospiraceae bacterium]
MLSLKNISKSYQNKNIQNLVLKNLSININSGEHILLTGESGCGKTTLLNIIAGILPVDSGTMEYGDFGSLNTELRRTQYRYHYVGIIPQTFCLIEHLTVLNNIGYVLHLHRLSLKDIGLTEKVYQLLELLHIRKFADTPVNRLSIGQKQRVAIARALILSPDIILADEPTSALDTKTTELIIKLFSASKSTLVIISHNKEFASICNAVYRISDGEFDLG